jgi:hypothetical protein
MPSGGVESRQGIREMPLAEVMENMRDDEIKWNAGYAADELVWRYQKGGESAAVKRALDTALFSDDSQQQKIALRALLLAPPRPPPGDWGGAGPVSQ